MRLILDTNILVYGSGVDTSQAESERRKQSECGKLIQALSAEPSRYPVRVSREILNEYYNRERRVRNYIANFLKSFKQEDYLRVESLPPLDDVRAFLEQVRFDRNDYKFVELAVSEQIKLIVSEDSEDYKKIRQYLQSQFGIEVLTAQDALATLFNRRAP